MSKFKQDPFQTSLSLVLYAQDRDAFLLKIHEIAQGRPFIFGEQPLADDKLKLTIIAASLTPTQTQALNRLKDGYRGQTFSQAAVAAKAVSFPDH